jgi:hypothetical protein
VVDGHKDYSGTPLWKKLGIKDGSRVLITGDVPARFVDELEAIAPLPNEVEFLSRVGRDLDVIVMFALASSTLERRFGALMRAMQPAGRLWIAWPKKASTLRTDLDFGSVQGHGLAAGLVDNKTASITDAYQGCQFVYRLKDRPAPIR